jgi:hypothetical protein
LAATPALLNDAPKVGWPFSVALTSGKPAVITVPARAAAVGTFTSAKSGTVEISPATVVISSRVSGANANITCTAPKTLPAAAIAKIKIS